MEESGEVATGATLTIDELARVTGMTARNIRAHQSRGLLPPPEVRSRTGYYTPEHVERIRLIQDMQAQGFNLKAIERLLELGADPAGGDPLAPGGPLLAPWSRPEPELIGRGQLESTLPELLEPEPLDRAQRIGLLRPIEGDGWEVPAPGLLRALRGLVESGIALEQALAACEALGQRTGAIARELVGILADEAPDGQQSGEPGPRDEPDPARAALERLRAPVAEALLASFDQELRRALEARLERPGG